MKPLVGLRLAILLPFMAASPCWGAIAVTWLEEPITLWTEWTTQYEPLDLNSDGITDYVFAADIGFLGARSDGDNQYLIWPSGGPNIGGDIEPLPEGFEIGPSSGDDSWMEWFGDGIGYDNLITCLSGAGGPGCVGRFADQRAYMGVEFEINDSIHYGWIDLYVGWGGYGQIYGWGYETESGISIRAGAVAIPEPATTMLFIGGLLTIGCTLRRAKARRG